ncbi:uncharacterized protein N0V89_001481 [Didymosphaeria variabile]|uniref:Glucose-methanol-choline oxidoreductase N-terminal domain-containing protein n=1 Tax=Didymosphaeria variabile TaxID=1932322 RepID=A0A9W8XYT7_9PLEO|nr:uncharacterized protein N0V89_001481 [Didymosphaeria variabile]KAJ4360912.1 hypothetical protein N0V89_001481 [Didymosphaeria variabile]
MSLLVIGTFLLHAAVVVSELSDGRARSTSSQISLKQTLDYVIVGGGLAGLTVAARLAEDPNITVGVFEAGDFYENTSGNLSRVPGYGAQVSTSGADWGLTTSPQAQLDGRSADYHIGKTVGGSTAVNLMAYHRSTKGAYNRWAALVGDDSYRFSNFLPWMRKAVNFTPANTRVRAKNATVPKASPESYDSPGGPIDITFANWANPVSSYAKAGWKDLGLSQLQDVTSGALIGNQYVPMTERATDQSRCSARAFFDQAENSGRQNLYLFTKSTAQRVNFDSRNRAVSVTVETNQETFEIKARKEVILAAGALHTPQLLLLSGIGPQDTLNRFNISVVKNLPGVGQNLIDHPNFLVAYEAFATTASSMLDPGFASSAITEYDKYHTGVLTHSMADHFAWGKLSKDEVSEQTVNELSELPQDWPHYMAVLSDLTWGPGQYAQGIVMLQAVTSRGSISIASSCIEDPPVLNVSTLSTETDRDVAVASFKIIRQFFNTTSLRKITGANVLPGIDAQATWSDAEIETFLRQSMSPGNHGCCTAAMGKGSDPNTVVDTHGRVTGTKGLRVVDASVMPFLPPGNPMGTLYGLAEKLAADIKAGS